MKLRTRMNKKEISNGIMTKERLAAYRSNRKEISELEYKLTHRWQDEGMIGRDVILDYRTGYPIPKSIVGFDYERYTRLQEQDLKRKEWLTAENMEIDKFIDSITDSLTRRIFTIYYIDDDKVSQEQISKKLFMDRSRISRKIDDYLKNAQKAQKAQV